MSSARDTAGETFNNTYRNSTLVGNWLEDRLQRGTRDGHRIATQDDGLLADPRITRARNAPQVRMDLMHSTYNVDYGGHNVTDGSPTSAQAGGEGEADDGTRAPARQQQSQQQVLLASSATRLDSTHGKTGVDRALLFSKDPVADPTAELPVSTNTDTYGAFFNDGTHTAADDGVTGASAQNTRRSGSGTAKGDTASGMQSEERNLYESVLHAKTRQAIPSTTAAGKESKAASRGAAAARSSSSMRSTMVVGFTALAAPAPGHSNVNATADDEDDFDERWCTTKQTADVPVEHCVFQRRLPPARV